LTDFSARRINVVLAKRKFKILPARVTDESFDFDGNLISGVYFRRKNLMCARYFPLRFDLDRSSAIFESFFHRFFSIRCAS
jgi:hypothetical protein